MYTRKMFNAHFQQIKRTNKKIGRGLLDSVLVANKVLDEIKRRKKMCVFFKVNFEKAYDYVRWEFIYYMLKKES